MLSSSKLFNFVVHKRSVEAIYLGIWYAGEFNKQHKSMKLYEYLIRFTSGLMPKS